MIDGNVYVGAPEPPCYPVVELDEVRRRTEERRSSDAADAERSALTSSFRPSNPGRFEDVDSDVQLRRVSPMSPMTNATGNVPPRRDSVTSDDGGRHGEMAELFVCMVSLRHISAIWLLVPTVFKTKTILLKHKSV